MPVVYRRKRSTMYTLADNVNASSLPDYCVHISLTHWLIMSIERKVHCIARVPISDLCVDVFFVAVAYTLCVPTNAEAM